MKEHRLLIALWKGLMRGSQTFHIIRGKKRKHKEENF